MSIVVGTSFDPITVELILHVQDPRGCVWFGPYSHFFPESSAEDKQVVTLNPHEQGEAECPFTGAYGIFTCIKGDVTFQAYDRSLDYTIEPDGHISVVFPATGHEFHGSTEEFNNFLRSPIGFEPEEPVEPVVVPAPVYVVEPVSAPVPVLGPVPAGFRRIDIATIFPNLKSGCAPVVEPDSAPVVETVSVPVVERASALVVVEPVSVSALVVEPILDLDSYTTSMKKCVSKCTGGAPLPQVLPFYTTEIASQARELLDIIMKDGNEKCALTFLNGEFSKVFIMLLKFRVNEQLDDPLLPFGLFHFAYCMFQETFENDVEARWNHFCWFFQLHSMTFP